jgi:hypothetical protein
VIAQEPELLNPATGAITFPLRANGSNIRNTAAANFNAQFSEEIGAVLGYSNNLYDYDKNGPGSYSALLDRMEHLILANLRWQVLPSTVALVGYQYGITDYTSKQELVAGSGLTSSIRDNNSHYVYLGVDQAINPKLNASVRIGAQFTQYDNAPGGDPDDSTISPYVDANATYNFAPDSAAQLGVRHARNATDILGATALGGGVNTANLTLDQESTVVYTSISHRIGRLTGSIIGQFQDSEFQGGSVHNEGELFWSGGLNLSYEINKFISAETGYNYDRLDSDVSDRSYTRNRVYIGIRASY